MRANQLMKEALGMKLQNEWADQVNKSAKILKFDPARIQSNWSIKSKKIINDINDSVVNIF
jgi:hypothetical protein